jgi:hypothetical protein
MSVRMANFEWLFPRGKRKAVRCFTASCGLLASLSQAQAAPLMEEGFNYPAGSALAANPPWSGTIDPSAAVVSGNLTLGNFQGTTPPGNMLQISAGTGVSVYRNFSDSPITSVPGAAVYFCALLNCTPLSTNSQFIASLLEAGATSSGESGDPLDLYATADPAGGYRLSIRRGGSDRATAGLVLAANTTHVIVLKFTFGTNGNASLYLDPTLGGSEPSSANARTENDDDGGGYDAANLQVVRFHSPAAPAQGTFIFDTVRIGTNWSDVALLNRAPIVAGPPNLSVCSGNPAVFSLTMAGTPPFTYQWLTNGISAAGATNDTYTVPSPTPADAANNYSVVVNNAFGTVTSRVATLAISYLAPAITLSPADQPVTPGISSVTFNVSASGDPPLSFQWRTNGVPIPGATNTSYTLNNPAPSAGSNTFDVLVTNVCGVATSSSAVLLFPHAFLVCDALPGFFSGVNLITTNSSGMSLFVWSSPDPNQSITNWTLEGPLQEQPLNDGSGNSRYSINVNPVVSPVYYLLGQTTSGPYLQPVPVQWITTDIYGNNYFYSSLLAVSPAGILGLSAPPAITQPPLPQTALVGKTVTYNVTVTGAGPLAYQWYFNATSALADATNATLTLPSVTATNAGLYIVVVTNTYGSVTSTPALLTVVPAPQLGVVPAPGSVRLNAAGVAGDTYWLQAATSLNPPAVWVTVATNVADATGVVQFSDTNLSGTAGRFYRLVAP